MITKSRELRRAARQQVMLESLENRALMSKNLDMDIELGQYAPPPAVVEYAGITGLNQPPSVDPNSTENTEPRMLGIYDATWGGSSFGRPTYWTSLAAWFPSGKLDISRAAVERVADISQNGGNMVWRNFPVPPKTLTVLDFEHPELEVKTPTFLADRLRWFNAKAPDAMVGFYGYPFGNTLNLDDFARFDDRTRAEFERQLLSRREILDESDFICFDAYLLSEQTAERDMLARKNMANALRELFPDKPVIPFVWGAYHTEWNAEESVFSDEVTRRFVEMSSGFDAVMIWGRRSDNEKLIAAYQDAASIVLPAGRAANWANDPVPQTPAPSSQPTPPATGTSSSQPTIGDDVLGEAPPSP